MQPINLVREWRIYILILTITPGQDIDAMCLYLCGCLDLIMKLFPECKTVQNNWAHS